MFPLNWIAMSQSEFNETKAKTMALDSNKSIYDIYYNPYTAHIGYKCHRSFAMVLDPKKSKEGKLRVCSQALHPEFSYPLIDVAEMSIEKGYAPLNWVNFETVTAIYLIEACQRHLDRVKMGIDVNDQEEKQDGTPCREVLHMAQVAYNALMYCQKYLNKTLKDDRLFKDGEIK